MGDVALVAGGGALGALIMQVANVAIAWLKARHQVREEAKDGTVKRRREEVEIGRAADEAEKTRRRDAADEWQSIATEYRRELSVLRGDLAECQRLNFRLTARVESLEDELRREGIEVRPWSPTGRTDVHRPLPSPGEGK